MLSTYRQQVYLIYLNFKPVIRLNTSNHREFISTVLVDEQFRSLMREQATVKTFTFYFSGMKSKSTGRHFRKQMKTLQLYSYTNQKTVINNLKF